MRPGAQIDYRIRVGALPLRWRTTIESFRPATLFIDCRSGSVEQWRVKSGEAQLLGAPEAIQLRTSSIWAAGSSVHMIASPFGMGSPSD